MTERSKWITRKMKCPEGDYKAELLVELWQEEGDEMVKSIHCNNPRLSGLDNWDCRWSCWEKIQESP